MMADIKLNTRRLKMTLVGVALVCLVLWLLAFRGTVSRSGTWRPLAGVRLGAVGLYNRQPEDESRIPRIIHQTWSSTDVPHLLRSWVGTWLKHHPGWEYWFWTDRDIRMLIMSKYPDYLSLYDSYPDMAYRADAFRYFVLYEYGGVYADLDMEVLRPLDPVIRDHTCILSQEPLEHAHFLSGLSGGLVSNALMACRPGHPFFERLITHLSGYAGLLEWNGVLHATGPYMLNEVYAGYQHVHLEQGPNAVHLADPVLFHPTVDNSMLDTMREMCVHSMGKSFPTSDFFERQKQLCDRLTSIGFRNEPISSESYTNHHWTHTWAGPKYDPWGIRNSDRTFNIKELSRS